MLRQPIFWRGSVNLKLRRVTEIFLNQWTMMIIQHYHVFYKRFSRTAIASNIQIAFAIAVCTTFLNPKYKYINAKESTMRQKVKHYVVGFRNFVLNCNIFLLFTNLLITLKNKLEKRESLTPGNDDDIGSSEGETEEETEELKGTSIH
jgi:hypothetical protein